MLITSFDPGLEGGWCHWDTAASGCRIKRVGKYAVNEDGRISRDALYLDLGFAYANVTAVVEKTLVLPGQGAKAAFTQGLNYGWLLSAVDNSHGRRVDVAPITWTTWLHRHARSAKDTKKDTWAALQVLLSPEELAMIPRGPRSGKPHEGIMDAIGIALWAHNNSGKL
jgi:hypothetical protein